MKLQATMTGRGEAPRKLVLKCPECGRVFDMSTDADAAEWVHGHDCEEQES